MQRLSLEERFWAKVLKTEGCWEWQGGKNPRGYGHISQMDAHRLSYEFEHGPIPYGHDVCHRCDNPSCVNPSHLFLGTHQENVADMVRKGRGLVGVKNGNAKIDESQVRDIRSMRRAGIGVAALCERFGLARRSVYDILSGRNWSHVI